MNDLDLIVHNGKITTNGTNSEVAAVAFTGGRVAAVGTDAEVLKFRGPATTVIDLAGRRAVPGLNDSHLHLIRGGLTEAYECPCTYGEMSAGITQFYESDIAFQQLPVVFAMQMYSSRAKGEAPEAIAAGARSYLKFMDAATSASN